MLSGVGNTNGGNMRLVAKHSVFINTWNWCYLSNSYLSSSDFKMPSSEQCTNIKFCVLLRKSSSETFQVLIEIYGNEAIKNSQHATFHESCINTEEDSDMVPCHCQQQGKE